MNKKKSIFIVFYYVFVFIWDLATLLISIGLMNLDNIFANIFGFCAAIITPYHFFYAIDIKKVICYEDFFIVKRNFCTQKVCYRKFKDYWFFTSITNNNIVVRFKKFQFPIHINQNMFTQDEIKNFIEILEKNNIKRYSWFS